MQSGKAAIRSAAPSLIRRDAYVKGLAEQMKPRWFRRASIGHWAFGMQSVLIVIHLIVVIAMVGVVLLQRSEGGGLGLGGGGSGGVSGFMTGRGQTNALTRTTAILATIFFATSMALSIMASFNRAPRSILDNVAPTSSGPAAPGAPNAPAGGFLDELKRLQDQGGGGQPAPPAPPAPPTEPRVPTQQ
jgi:preprotein translocase subunit SecG